MENKRWGKKVEKKMVVKKNLILKKRKMEEKQ